MRKALASALNSKNLATKFNDCHLDKIHALGIVSQTNPIGVDAIRFIDGMHHTAYKPIIYKLLKTTKTRFKDDSPVMLKLCERVVFERIFSFCQSCGGRAEIHTDKKVLKCHSCEGSGLSRHSDRDRALAIGVSIESYQKIWAKKFQNVQQTFNDKYSSALKTTQHITKLY